MIYILGLGVVAVLLGAAVLVRAAGRRGAGTRSRAETVISFVVGALVVLAGAVLVVLGTIGVGLGSGD
ncbi:hypothetical protein [Kineosporia sp. A_224]|uniref:hypothetical protein n=1 Tax=Kineosporia sp. A_224 TaxID=1962180 RepID=UPI000B4BC4B9|nr:hypothetical protein [Kineosporia sp. A_224]